MIGANSARDDCLARRIRGSAVGLGTGSSGRGLSGGEESDGRHMANNRVVERGIETIVGTGTC
jgi:hypothetical protein